MPSASSFSPSAAISLSSSGVSISPSASRRSLTSKRSAR
jgi:hypothetical protein